jgi:hypothetical protein
VRKKINGFYRRVGEESDELERFFLLLDRLKDKSTKTKEERPSPTHETRETGQQPAQNSHSHPNPTLSPSHRPSHLPIPPQSTNAVPSRRLSALDLSLPANPSSGTRATAAGGGLGAPPAKGLSGPPSSDSGAAAPCRYLHSTS